MNKIMKVWIQREDTGFIDIDLPTSPGDLQSTIDTFLMSDNMEDNPVYISDYEYLGKISYKEGEDLNLVDQFTDVFSLNRKLNNIANSNNSDAAIALFIADMITEDELDDLDYINACLDKYNPILLDENIFKYNKKIDDEYYWIILDMTNPDLSAFLSSNNAECYFDIKNYVEDNILGDATVTSTGYLVWHY